MDLDALLRVPHVDPEGGFDISPAGTHVAFAWNGTGQWEIYELPLDSPDIQAAPARQLTSGPGAKFSPHYAPDGRRLAYVLDSDGSEAFDLFVCDLATGRHFCLTPNTPEAIQPKLAWSPDGSQLAFLCDRAGVFEPYVISAGGGPARKIMDSRHPAWDVDWSPDGRWLAVVCEMRGQDHGTFVVPLNGGAARPVAVAGESIDARNARWAPPPAGGNPGGMCLAFSSTLHGVLDVGLYHLDSGDVRWLTSGPGDKELPSWSADGRCLVYVTSDGPLSRLAVADLETGQEQRLQVEPGVHVAPHFMPGGGRVLVTFDNPRLPDDLWLLPLAGGSPRQLTNSLPSRLRGVPFVMPVAIDYPSFDGQLVPALLYRPAGSREPTPAVIYIHGGPNWLSQVTWQPLIQHMVSRGWTVLAPNYRGSTGYGLQWQLANRFDLGGGDTRDVVAGADALVRQGLADPRRIAVTGASHGGYLTMMALTQYPDRWAGGSAVVPFLNWFTSHANVRPDLQHWDRENFGDPVTNRDLWYERSPFFFLDRIQAPVQMICGAHDVRCPASESLQARDTLQALGRKVDLVLYPDEGHTFLKTENVVDAALRRVDFLSGVLDPSL